MFSTGCVTWFNNMNMTPDRAYSIGRKATVLYLFKRKDVNQKYRDALKDVYLTVDKVATSLDPEQSKNLLNIIKASIAQNVDDEQTKIIVMEFVNAVWEQLTANYDLETMKATEVAVIVLEFHNGVKSALDDYGIIVK